MINLKNKIFGGKTMFSFQPLWITLQKKNIKRTDLLNNPGISSSTLAKMGKNEYVSPEVLDKICIALDCEVEDIIKHIKP